MILDNIFVCVQQRISKHEHSFCVPRQQCEAFPRPAIAAPRVFLSLDRGYAERQKIMAVLVEGQFVEVFLTPQTLGGGMYNIFPGINCSAYFTKIPTCAAC